MVATRYLSLYTGREQAAENSQAGVAVFFRRGRDEQEVFEDGLGAGGSIRLRVLRCMPSDSPRCIEVGTEERLTEQVSDAGTGPAGRVADGGMMRGPPAGAPPSWGGACCPPAVFAVWPGAAFRERVLGDPLRAERRNAERGRSG